MSKQHGGKRTPGKGKRLGRPPKDEPKVAGSFRVSADVEAYLREMGTSAEIDRLAKNSKRFKDWLRSR
jgi:hypothetical protein